MSAVMSAVTSRAGSVLVPVAVAAVLMACASSAPQPGAGARWPAWVLQPDAAGGISAAECVESSGNLSVDRTHAAAAARVALARNLEVNIQSSDELSAVKSSQGALSQEKSQNTQTFRSSSRLLTEKALANTRVTRLEEVMVDKRAWLCAEVGLDAAGSRGLVQQAVAATGTPSSADVEEMLLQQFRRRPVPSQAVQGAK